MRGTVVGAAAGDGGVLRVAWDEDTVEVPHARLRVVEDGPAR
jgi:hypothetical protein